MEIEMSTKASVTAGRDGPRSCQGTKTFKPSSSKRQQLSAEEAAEIYLMRPKPAGKGTRPKRGAMLCCKSIAPKFGVSAKTIRDIWRGRTWIEATRHLWTEEEREERAKDHDDSDSDSELPQEDQHQRACQSQFMACATNPGLLSMPSAPQMDNFAFQQLNALMSCGGNFPHAMQTFAMQSRTGMDFHPQSAPRQLPDCSGFHSSFMPPNLMQRSMPMAGMGMMPQSFAGQAPRDLNMPAMYAGPQHSTPYARAPPAGFYLPNPNSYVNTAAYQSPHPGGHFHPLR